MLAFYKRVVATAGYDSSEMLMSRGDKDANNRPSKLELAKYKVYLMIDDVANKSHLTTAHYNDVTPYLDMGGNVWVWALSPFGAYYGAGSAGMKSLAAKPIPKDYFDVVGEFFGGWAETCKTRWLAHGLNSAVVLPTNEEFLGGLPLGTSGMPGFDVDSMKYSSTYSVFDPEFPVDWRAAPNTNYFQKYLFSEPLWLFRSCFGDFVPDSLRSYVSGLNGRVIGLRYDSGIFKTSVYGFSMYMLPEDQAVDIFQKTMEWFLKQR
jgi:hypothetical protein